MVFDVDFTAPNDELLVRSLLDISGKYHYSYMSVSVVGNDDFDFDLGPCAC